MEDYLFRFILVVLFTLYPGYASHTAPRYELGSYDGLFLTHDDIRELKKDFENMMPGTIKKSQTEWIVSSTRKEDDDCDSDFSSEEGGERRLFTRRRGTCSTCCETQWKATNLIKVSYNGTEYSVARGRDQYQIVFQGVCPSKKNWCGSVKCEEDDSFFYPVLVEKPRDRDLFNTTQRQAPLFGFVPIRVSRFCRCTKGPGM